MTYRCEAGHETPAPAKHPDPVINCPYPIGRTVQCGRRAKLVAAVTKEVSASKQG